MFLSLMNHDLRSFLFKPEGIFESPAALARNLAKVSAKYDSPKSTEALLSQIIRRQKPIPDAFVQEMNILLKEGDRSGGILGKFEIIAEEHNRGVKIAQIAAKGRDGLAGDFFSDINSAKHSNQLIILNDSWVSECGQTFWFAKLKHQVEFNLNNPNADIAISRVVERNESYPLNVSFWVPNKATGIQIWEAYFRSTHYTYEPDDNMNEKKAYYHIAENIREEISRIFDAADASGRLRVYVLPEPINAICHTSICAFSPEDVSKLAVYALIGGNILQLSDNEALSWKWLLANAHSQILKGSSLLRWSDSKDAITNRYSFGGG